MESQYAGMDYIRGCPENQIKSRRPFPRESSVKVSQGILSNNRMALSYCAVARCFPSGLKETALTNP
jgi:hypothetical protein